MLIFLFEKTATHAKKPSFCMKLLALFPLALASLTASAQQIRKFYDYQWKDSDAAHARFYTVIEPTDSGWHRQDFFLHGPSLQMDGYFEDSACKKHNGKFTFAYPNKTVESTGRYLHGKKQGLWLTYHLDGSMADSTVYEAGFPVGTTLAWYANGYPSDSAVYNADGSGVHVGWFDNGNVSYAGMLSAGFKPHGIWKYYHKNGHVSAVELYDHGVLKDKQYFTENGEPMTDTTNRDSKAVFRNGEKDWQKYLGTHLYWPQNFEITNADVVVVVVTVTINEDGKVEDAYVSIPFAPRFDEIALNAVRHSPPWTPARQHNRKIKYHYRQPVTFQQSE